MNIVYLADGQSAYLKEKIGERFIVNKIFTYEDQIFGGLETTSGEDVLVDKVFTSKPVPLFVDEIKSLRRRKTEIESSIESLRDEYEKKKYELNSVKNSIISQDKFIINKSELVNAKSLAFFPEKKVMPHTLIGKNDRNLVGLKISMVIKVGSGEENSWGYQIYDTEYSDYSYYLCKKDGIIINPTQEQLDDIIHRRVSELEISDWDLSNIPDQYLTPELLERKQKYKYLDNEKEIEKQRKIIEEAEKAIDRLTNK